MKTISRSRGHIPSYACSESENSMEENKSKKTKITWKHKFIIFMVASLLIINLA
jgi:hypothetical protein